MASLTNTKIKNTYVSLLKVADNGQLDAALQEITDGAGNVTGVQLNTGGDLAASGTVSFGSLKDTGENITISKFVDAADGIGSNNNDTTIPTSAAVVSYVASQVTLEDLDFTGDSGTGAVDLDSQTLNIIGTANEIVTAAGAQTLTIGLPATINVNVTGDLTGNVTATSVLVDGVIATTQTIGDNSTKVATTAYVDAAITAEDLDIAGDSGTGAIDLDSQVLTVAGTANEVETSASGQTITVGLPSNVTIGNDLTVTTNATVGGTLGVTGATGVDGNFDVATNKFTVQAATGNTAVAGTLGVTGNTTLSTVDATGLASLDGGIDVDGAFTVADTSGNISTSGTLGVTGTSTLGVINASGLASLDAGIDVDGVFTVADTTGNVSTTGTLAVTGITTLTDDLAVDTDTLFVDVSTDRVGINKAVPTVALDVTGDITSSGTITGVTLTGTLSTAAQTNITSVGTLSSLAVSGNLTVDTDTLFVDAAANNVGIGTASIDSGFILETAGNIKAGTNLSLGNSGGDYDGVGYNIGFTGTGDNWNYLISDTASLLEFNSGGFIFSGAGAGTAGNPITLAERMRIDSSGNVGIGGVPSHLLDIQSTSPVLRIKNTTAPTTGGTSSLLFEGINNFSGVSQSFINSIQAGNSGATSLAFGTSGSVDATATERMRIDSSGNTQFGDGNNFNPLLQFAGSGRVAASPGYSFVGDLDTGMFSPNTTNTIAFSTAGTESMRITSGGEVLVGTTSVFNAKLSVQSPAAFATSNFRSDSVTAADTSWTHFYGTSSTNTVADIQIFGNGNIVNANNSYGAISDIKLKENIVDATPKLDDLLQVKIRNFNYIDDNKKQIGVVAQELEEIFPSMIDESPDYEEVEVTDEEGNVKTERVKTGTKTKSVKYSVFVPMLIKAMQEQQEIINDLKARIETLEAK